MRAKKVKLRFLKRTKFVFKSFKVCRKSIVSVADEKFVTLYPTSNRIEQYDWLVVNSLDLAYVI